MRLQHLAIRAFRGFNTHQEFDLDADIILLYGPNGHGKSSLVEAILWCLTGSLSHQYGRDATRDQPEQNRFATEPAQVSLTLAGEPGPLRLTRTRNELIVEVSGSHALRGAAAEQYLSRQLGLWPDPHELQRRHFLLQDTVAQFVLDTRPAERFRWVSQLLGVDLCQTVQRILFQARGRVEREIEILEEKSSWLIRNLEKLRAEESQEREIVAGEPPAGDLPRSLSQQVDGILARLRKVWPETPAGGVTEPADTPQEVLRRCALLASLLQQARTGLAREIQKVHSLQLQAAHQKENLTVLAELEREHQALRQEEEQLSQTLDEVRRLVAEAGLEYQHKVREKEAMAAQRTNAAQLLELGRQLARGNQCPLCQQPIAYDDLLQRIETALAGLDAAEQSAVRAAMEAEQSYRTAQARLREIESKLHEVQQRLRSLERRRADIAAELAQWRQAAARYGARLEEPESVHPALTAARQKLEARLSELNLAESDIAHVETVAKRFQAARRLQELERRRNHLEAELSQTDSRLSLLAEVARRVRAMDEAARRKERELVGEILGQYQPVFDLLYRRIDPHPLFRRLHFDISHRDQRGELYLRVYAGEVQANAALTFSQAQANALGVVLFLGMHLMQGPTPLHFVVLDDPMQSLDDIHILGLADLLQALSEHRQLLVTTHDLTLYRLLRRKLRPVRPGQRLVGYRLEAYSEDGPEVTREEQKPPEHVEYWVAD